MLNAEIIDIYIKQNGETPDNRYLLKDAGEGNFIARWEYDFPKPTKKDLKPYAEKYIQQEAVELVRIKRAQEYPTIGDQLDAIMKWVAGENEITVTPELKSIAMQCRSVKAKYPKPEKEKK